MFCVNCCRFHAVLCCSHSFGTSSMTQFQNSAINDDLQAELTPPLTSPTTLIHIHHTKHNCNDNHSCIFANKYTKAQSEFDCQSAKLTFPYTSAASIETTHMQQNCPTMSVLPTDREAGKYTESTLSPHAQPFCSVSSLEVLHPLACSHPFNVCSVVIHIHSSPGTKHVL